jgi:hypothetical protein
VSMVSCWVHIAIWKVAAAGKEEAQANPILGTKILLPYRTQHKGGGGKC